MLPSDLIEQGEANAVESAILWRAQTILESLLPAGELDAWIHRVGLAGAVGELKSEVERMETVVNGVKGRAVGNKPLARSLARVKELMYDADDVVDELDYCRLQHMVKGVILAPATESECIVGDGDNTDGAEHIDASASTDDGIPDNNGRKNRSKERDYFHITPAANGGPAKAKCIDCGTEVLWGHGTSVLRKHRNSARCKNNKRTAIDKAPNCPSAEENVQNGAILSTDGSEARKRMRTEGNVVTTAPLWDKAKFSERIHKIALELGSIRGYVIEYLKDSIASSGQSNNTSDTRVRTSGFLHGKVYGRNVEKKCIMTVIEAAKSDNITVVPIVGIVGVGKTTLAKLVYNDRLVKNQFERIWVWVSNIFDEVRVTREILDVVTLNSHEGASCDRESYEGVSNYTKLQEFLKNHMACRPKKFLLVLDDVNDCMDDSHWKDLLDALGSICTKGNVIIVTTRNWCIARRLATTKPVKLESLKYDDFWLLLKACAFGDFNYKEHLDIGRQIATKLKGNPLAAECAAKMLREQPTLGQWKSIIKNGVWVSLQLHGGIVTTLKIIYYQLSYQLQQCFLFCSIFPDNHEFHIDDLVSLWMSLGFVKSNEIGRDCFNALVNSCLFEQVITFNSLLLNKKFYVMCGMMHEFARLVSRSEFATIDGLECKEVLPTVRHFSILVDSVYHKDEYGTLIRNMKFEEELQSIVPLTRRLRTLILIGNYDSLFFQCFHIFMRSLVNCTYLRYLKFENKGSNEALPISLSDFSHLKISDASQPVIIDSMNDFISMKHLVLTKGARGACSPTWSTCLQTIHLEDCEGCEILPSLESLTCLTKLKLKNMPEVTKLLIPPLKELVLIDMPKLDRCFSSSVRDLNSSLRVLDIKRCWVLNAFPVFESCEKFGIEQKSWLPNVSVLTIHECPHLVVSNPLPPASSIWKLSIIDVSTLPTMKGSSDVELRIGLDFVNLYSIGLTLDDKILSFHNLRTITRLEIMHCTNLWSVSLKGFRQLVCLKRMEIKHCTNFFSSDVPSMHTHEDMADTDFDALPSLECLSIQCCGITGKWLSVMLQHVRALEELHLKSCKRIIGLLIEGEENSLSNLTWSSPRALSQGDPDVASTRSCSDKLLCVPSNLVPSLKKMSIEFCELKLLGDFSGFTSLEELRIVYGPKLIMPLAHGDEITDQANRKWLLPCSLGVLDIRGASLLTLQPCFPGDLTHLTVLKVSVIYGLRSLRLHSCTALEKLKIEGYSSVDGLEGVQFLRGLKYLEVYRCPGLPQCMESLSMQAYELCPRLERLRIDDQTFLTMPFCRHLTSLQCLQFASVALFPRDINVTGLTCEEETALQLLTSLQQLGFYNCPKLSHLPAGLHCLPSLKRLEIFGCPNISRLPGRGLTPSLEELDVRVCSKELTEQCRMLATSKLMVMIDGKCVN